MGTPFTLLSPGFGTHITSHYTIKHRIDELPTVLMGYQVAAL